MDITPTTLNILAAISMLSILLSIRYDNMKFAVARVIFNAFLALFCVLLDNGSALIWVLITIFAIVKLLMIHKAQKQATPK